ncbi:glycoside hydrolase superfamily [Xylariaceae sp. FL0255]|nr:glycoside hydrolase superfamily [Xylariaceae sp. FL0255]
MQNLRPLLYTALLVLILFLALGTYLPSSSPTSILDPYLKHHDNNPSTITTSTTTTATPNPSEEPANMAPGQYRSVAYFVNWAIYGRKHLPQHLPAQNLTHILYAFANVRPESGEVYLTDTWADTDIHWEGDSWNDSGTNLYGCLKQLNLLKKKHRHLKVLLSIGGWTYSANFKQPASTAAGREKFASSCVELVKNLGFDGIDIDWEYPANQNEAADFVALLQTVRKALDEYSARSANGYHFELTVACPAGAKNYDNMDLAGMDRYIDFWNLMAYDYAGSWDSVAGHQANLFRSSKTPAATPFDTESAVQAYMHKGGVASNKIVLGMPIYGRAFSSTEGPGTPFSGIGEGTWEAGVHDYKKLPLPNSQVHLDETAGATYCYDPATKTMVTYDTVPMQRRKAEYVKEKGLGGAMWWESSADKEGSESLIGNVVEVLRSGGGGLDSTQNCLAFPESKYDNLRAGFPNN